MDSADVDSPVGTESPRPDLRARLRRWGLGVLSFALFAVAVAVLAHQMRAYDAADLLHALRELRVRQIAGASALTLLYYVALSGYDALAFRYIDRSVPPSLVVTTGMTAFAVSNSLGRPLLSGGTVRYRLYRSLGLKIGEFTRLITFCSFAPWIGFLVVGGVVFLAVPVALPKSLHVPFATVRPLGAVLLVAAAGYLTVRRIVGGAIRVRGLEINHPGARLVAGAVGVAVFDWLLAAAAIELLLPPDLESSYWQVLAVYQISHLGLVLSRVPGGLGILESLMVLFLAPAASAPRVLGAMLAFRVIFFLAPLLVGVLWFTAHGVRRRGPPPGQKAKGSERKFRSASGPPNR
ncbi:MAG: UPF0104 family protein [Myxococcales bacterium]|nr:UPF0104 family protein [Myxococcales bacterium]